MILFQLAALPLLAACGLFLFSHVSGLTGRKVRSYPRFGSTIALFRSAFAVSVIWLWCNACGWFQPAYNHLLRLPGQSLLSCAATARQRSASFQPSSHPIFILLGGGTERTGPNGALRPQGDSIEKIAVAAQCYALAKAAGAQPTVIVSGGNPQHHAATEADTYAPALRELGVPAADLGLERRSLNTYQNAEFVNDMLVRQFRPLAGPATTPTQDITAENERVRSLYVITTALHMRRSLLDFAVFGRHPTPIAPPLHGSAPRIWPSLHAMGLADAALHEIVGIAVFYVYRAIGRY